MECGKRVGKGVVTYPCEVPVMGSAPHDGPCMSPDNTASVRQRTAWSVGHLAAQPDPVVFVDNQGDPVAAIDPSGALHPAHLDGEGELRTLREGYHPSTVAQQADLTHVKGHRPEDQPLPVPNDGPSMHDRLIVMILERKQLGLSRYGSLLQAHNGRDALRDALEELVDLGVYLLQAIEERDHPAPR